MAKRLYRSRDDRVIAGVCGGIAKYFDIDPVVVRAAFVVAVFVAGMGIWVYPVLWLIIPDEGQTKSKLQQVIEDVEIVDKKKDKTN